MRSLEVQRERESVGSTGLINSRHDLDLALLHFSPIAASHATTNPVTYECTLPLLFLPLSVLANPSTLGPVSTRLLLPPLIPLLTPTPDPPFLPPNNLHNPRPPLPPRVPPNSRDQDRSNLCPLLGQGPPFRLFLHRDLEFL